MELEHKTEVWVLTQDEIKVACAHYITRHSSALVVTNCTLIVDRHEFGGYDIIANVIVEFNVEKKPF